MALQFEKVDSIGGIDTSSFACSGLFEEEARKSAPSTGENETNRKSHEARISVL